MRENFTYGSVDFVTSGDALYIYSFQMMVIVLWFNHAAKSKNRCARCFRLLGNNWKSTID